MAPRGPASAPAQISRVIALSEDDLAGIDLDLGVALQAEIVVALDQHLRVDRAVGTVANRAAFAKRLVFKREGAGLFPMALGARFIESGHGQAARRFHHVPAVRIVALRAIHAVLDDRMVMGKIHLRVNIQMTLVTRRRILPRVDNRLAASAAHGHVFAPWPMTGFTAGQARPFHIVLVESAMRTYRENPGEVRVTIGAGLVADEGRSFDFQWHHDGTSDGGTRTQEEAHQRGRGDHPE